MKNARSQVRYGAIAGAAALLLTIAACAPGGESSPGPTAAPSEPPAEGWSGELTIWSWEGTLSQVVDDFVAANPDVTINLANVGTGNDHYIALQNAIAAGTDAPDIAQVEYYAIPQFAIPGHLADLGPLGAGALEGTFTPGTWNAVRSGDGIFGLPMDSGPMALFYNETVFDEVGVDVPQTWDDYLEAARDLRSAGYYITNDTGDAGFQTSIIWQAGGKPFQVDGTNVTIDLADEGTARFTALWQQLIDEELLAPIGSWSDEWFQGLGDGTVASLVIGAWMPANLESGAPDGAGSWRAAPMPQWSTGGSDTAENGGSSLAVTEASDSKELAYAFLDYALAGPGVQTKIDQGLFPATVADLNTPEFLDREFGYFGGQKVNEVLSASAGDVVAGWQYLPFQVYANSVFNDHVGPVYGGTLTLQQGLDSWQQALITYGTQEGFDVQ